MRKQIFILLPIVALLTGCSLTKQKDVEEVTEDAIRIATESSAALAGGDAHVEVDLNQASHPHCMHCHFHCPVDQPAK